MAIAVHVVAAHGAHIYNFKWCFLCSTNLIIVQNLVFRIIS